MREIFSLFPDFKLHFTYNFKHNKWYVQSGFPSNICGKGNTLIEALNDTSKEIASYSQYTDNAKGKRLIKDILKSKQYIEYIGKYYLCIINSRDNDWKIIKVIRNNEIYYKVHNIKHGKKAIEELLESIDNMSIKPFGQGGFDGRMYRLTLGSGFNSTSITWWSGDEDNWSGLSDVLESISKIWEIAETL